VWLQPAGRSPVLLGRLNYDPNNQSGKLDAVTPYQTFRLYVTAEPATNEQQPSGVVVLEEDVVT